TLEDQDRRRWDQSKIAEATALLAAAGPMSRAGPYQLQAAIAAGHATARTAADTDWTALRELYDRLAELTPSPVVRLNRAVAVGMADGPQSGLDVVDGLAAQGILVDYYLLTATRADLLRRLERYDEAAAAYRQALAQGPATEAEHRFLTRRLNEVSELY
ncbi:MAG TPA: RNA polymerase subunit sigma-24, partial [Jatrophihabitans sp.]|nr:RNA polymerase subunit sigma-24 [Jatrophihabitans sp.]